MLAIFPILLAVTMLLAATWPLGSLLANHPFRRTFPKVAIGLILALAFYAAAVALVAIFAPRITIGLAAVVAVGVIAQIWRARPNFGHRRGLPPGSLALAPVEAWLDQSFYEKRAQLHGPVFKASHFFHPMVCVIGLDRGLELLRTYEDEALRAPEAAFARFVPCSFVRSMSPENHRKYRPILQAAVSSEVTDLAAPAIRTAIVRGLDAMAEACRANRSGQSLASYSQDALYELQFGLFFGIAPGSVEHQTFRQRYRVIDLSHQRRSTVPWSPSHRAVLQALRETKASLLQRIEGFPANGDRPPVTYLEAAWRHGGLEAVDDVVLTNLIYMVQVTCADLGGLFQWLLKKLSDHPEWAVLLQEVIREQGEDSTAATDLAERILAESLRMEQSEHIYRKVIKPIQFQGFRIPQGWLLRICVRESHRGSAAFTDSQTFNPDRFLNRTYGPTEYSPFGLFRKRCIGVQATKSIAGMFLKVLVKGYQWQVTGAGSPDFRGWHWTPGETFAIALQKRS